MGLEAQDNQQRGESVCRHGVEAGRERFDGEFPVVQEGGVGEGNCQHEEQGLYFPDGVDGQSEGDGVQHR